jgi:hypothetical protein
MQKTKAMIMVRAAARMTVAARHQEEQAEAMLAGAAPRQTAQAAHEPPLGKFDGLFNCA